MLPSFNWRTDTLLLAFLGVVFCALGGAFLCEFFPEEGWDWARVVVSTLSLQAGSLVVVHVILREQGDTWSGMFGLFRGKLPKVLAMGVLVGLLVLPLAWLVSALMREVLELFVEEPDTQMVVQTLQSVGGGWVYLLIGVIAVTIAPLGEEVLFRGLLYPFLKRHFRVEVAVGLSALLFGAIHMNIMTMPSLVLLALVLIWLYETTGNLLAPVAAHSVFNLANLLFLLVL